MTPPDVAPDGTVYFSSDIGRIVAFNPHTLSPNWIYQDGTLMYHPTASPLNDMVATGGVRTFGDLGFVKAINSSSGELLWTVDLPGAFYPEPRVVPVHHPRFTPDGNTVYVSTTILAGSESDPHSYLYAIQTHDVPATGDLSGDGAVDTLDLGILLSNWSIPLTTPGCGGAKSCPSDINGDGFVNSLDLGILLSHWG
jgi:outer membrane protein assembly factor BamB